MSIPDSLARAEFGDDHEGNPVDSNDLFVCRIRAVSPDADHLEKAAFLKGFVPVLAEMPDVQSDGYVTELKAHLRLADETVKSIKRDVLRFRKQRKPAPQDTPLTQNEVIARLERQGDSKSISPAQDFQDGTMYFAVMVEDQKYLVTSKRELLSFDEAQKNGLVLENSNVDTSQFSAQGLVSFLKGTYSVNPVEVYGKIHDYIRRFVIFTDERHAVYLALWTMGTYLFKLFDYFPYVWLNAEKGSGKSLLMKVLSHIAFNGEVLVNPTEAVIFRDVANNSLSMFIDEVEKLSKKDREAYGSLISLLNVGFEKGARVKRVERSGKDSFVIKKFAVYSPKMFAGINDIDDVLQDRTIAIRILRKKADEKVQRFRLSNVISCLQCEIRDDCYVLALECANDLAGQYHDRESCSPGWEHLTNRELDIWEPIIILADMIDVGLGSTEITDAMKSMSLESMEQKQETNVSENETYKILTVVKGMLEELQPLKEEGDTVVFDSDDVWNHFLATEEFAWLKDRSKSSLTRRLKKIQVKSERNRVEGKPVRMYVFNRATTDDLCERFNV